MEEEGRLSVQQLHLAPKFKVRHASVPIGEDYFIKNPYNTMQSHLRLQNQQSFDTINQSNLKTINNVDTEQSKTGVVSPKNETVSPLELVLKNASTGMSQVGIHVIDRKNTQVVINVQQKPD